MTIRSWLARSRGAPAPRSRSHAGRSGVTTPEPITSDDSAQTSTAARHNDAPRVAAGQIILVAVQKTGDDSCCVADFADDIPQAERLVKEWVEAGVDPDAVSILRATELPLNVSYEWDVKIRDDANEDSARESRKPPERSSQPTSHTPATAPTRPNLPIREPETSTAEHRETPSPSPVTTAPSGSKSGVVARANEFLHEIMPETPLQFRFDRIVWLGLWAASLFVLGTLLVASLSAGTAREFVIGGQPQASDSASVGSNVTANPTTAPAVSVSGQVPACLVNDCQCQDFSSQADAQAFFTKYPPPARQPVDPDADGLFCEWLPKIAPSPTR